MKKYLSFGGGVNSVAMMLMLLEQNDDFEAIFVDHGADYPETYEYFKMFQGWLKDHNHKEITVLKPMYIIKKDKRAYDSLYEYCEVKRIVPSMIRRWCTSNFKVKPINKYVKTPCFMYLGIDYGEQRRAKISVNNGVENRFPLIEYEISRDGCKDIIKEHGLPIPIKSGCYFCPFQSIAGWERLRMDHPELFCKAEKLETSSNKKRKEARKSPFYISSKNAPLRAVVSEDQMRLFKQDEFPPCECGL